MNTTASSLSSRTAWRIARLVAAAVSLARPIAMHVREVWDDPLQLDENGEPVNLEPKLVEEPHVYAWPLVGSPKWRLAMWPTVEESGQGCVHVRVLGYAIEVWYVCTGALAVASR